MELKLKLKFYMKRETLLMIIAYLWVGLSVEAKLPIAFYV